MPPPLESPVSTSPGEGSGFGKVDEHLTRHIAGAALLLIGVLRRGHLALRGAHQSYGALPTGGVYIVRDFEYARELLEVAGIAHQSDGHLALTGVGGGLAGLDPVETKRLLVIAYLRRRKPTWLAVVAGAEEVRAEYIPAAVEALLNELFPDRDVLARALWAARGRVDPARRAEVGEAGELLVVDELRKQRRDAGHADLAAVVFRVSQVSDSFGYDVIAPRVDGGMDHDEVKVARRAGSVLILHLSRHQVRMGRQDPDWRLIVCERGGAGDLVVAGWCRLNDQLLAALPQNVKGSTELRSRWDSVELSLPRSHLISGLPPLRWGGADQGTRTETDG